VVSLWAVPDEATAALMTAFYEGLRQGDDKATALRQAMLVDYSAPENWAAFTLIGETG
jgi:CHAT domain-containing protein